VTRGGVRVFAVEDTNAQVTWHDLPAGSVLSAGDAAVEVAEHGPGAAVLAGLPPDTALEVWVAEPERPAAVAGRLRTLPALPGPERCRVATVSDCHLGGVSFGHLPRMHHPAGAGIHATCLAAALDEAVAWGADLVVVKGDLTQDASVAEWEQAASLLAPVVAAGIPVEVVPGNHDRRDDGIAVERLATAGVRYTVGGVACRDLPGLRVLAADVTVPGHHGGLAAPVRDELVALSAEAPAGALVCTHQQPQRWKRATHWPPGLPGPDAAALLDGLAAAHPATLVTSGHTHRHRRRRHGPLVVTEVGSTKDFPGTWAGYVVADRGIRQVVRRIAAPDALRWTETTRRGYLGIWGPWSAGTLSARCFTHCWPA
jgi:Icc protein